MNHSPILKLVQFPWINSTERVNALLCDDFEGQGGLVFDAKAYVFILEVGSPQCNRDRLFLVE